MKWHKQLKVRICVLLVHIGLEVEVLIRKQLLTIRLIKVNAFIQVVRGKIKIVKRLHHAISMRLGHLLSKLLVSTDNLCGIFSNQRKCHCQLYLCQTIKDDLHTINYLIDRGADHNPDLLMSLAHDYEYYDLKEKIYSQLHCSDILLFYNKKGIQCYHLRLLGYDEHCIPF